jgi:chorismate dehydratase
LFNNMKIRIATIDNLSALAWNLKVSASCKGQVNFYQIPQAAQQRTDTNVQREESPPLKGVPALAPAKLPSEAGSSRVGDVLPAVPVDVDIDADFRSGAPAETLAWMAAGEVDAALVPVSGLPQLRGIAQPLGPYGIACTGRVSSVRLFARQPLDALIRSRTGIYVTQKSQTSRLLLRVLCWREFERQPRIVEIADGAMGRLLIGDESVDMSREEQGWPHSYDLGEWWFRQTGLPFVFARWVIRHGLEEDAQRALFDWLERCAAAAESPEGKAALAAHAVSEGRLQQGEAFAQHYYEQIRPRLTPSDLKGLQRFDALRWELDPCTKSA